MLPLHRKEKLDDVSLHSFPYRFARPAMFARQRKRLAPRQVQIGVGLSFLFFLWLIFHGGQRTYRYKSPYALASTLSDDTLPLEDVTILECTRWRSFASRSRCTALLNQGWEISGGDLLLDKGRSRTHLFVKRGVQNSRQPAITEIRVSSTAPADFEGWEGRPGGIWIKRRAENDVEETVTSIDFIHGNNIPELRRGRQYAPGGPLLIGEEVNLSYRKGLPRPREFPTLKVSETKLFKVLQVADLHLSTGSAKCRDTVRKTHELACEADTATLQFLRYLLNAEKPDFVAFTGDQVNGDSAPNAKSAIFKFARLCIERKIPFAVIFGNHDDEGDLSREELMRVSEELPYCVARPGFDTVSGVGNYVVAIEQAKSTDIAIALWFLDTHKYSPQERKYPGYDWLKNSQIAWFKWQYEQLKPWTQDALHTAFIHIPLSEYRTVTNAIVGEWREAPTAPRYNSGFRAALAEKNVMVISAGHDHANDYCMLDEMKGNRGNQTWMCYGGGIGYGGYGGYGGYKRRARIFEFDVSNKRIDSWKRVDEESHDPDIRSQRLHHQMLVYQGIVSKSALEVEIEGMNMTLNEYYESIRPPDITELVA